MPLSHVVKFPLHCSIWALYFGILGMSRVAAGPASQASENTFIRSRLEAVANRQQSQYGLLRDGDYQIVPSLEAVNRAAPASGIGWTYSWGVTLYGVLRSGDVTSNPAAKAWVSLHNLTAARDFLWLTEEKDRLDAASWNKLTSDMTPSRINRLVRLGDLDSCGAMGAEFIEAQIRGQEITPGELVVVERIIDWVSRRQARLPDGTMFRPTMQDEDKAWPLGTLWADDCYMACAPLAKWSVLTRDPQYSDDAARILLGMAKRLRSDTGVWYHGYSETRQEHSPIKWGRANGWVMMALAEVLSVLPTENPNREGLLGLLRSQIAGVAPLQAGSGLWRQILDDPGSWEETSCSCMFAFAIARAVNRGWVAPTKLEVAQRAVSEICHRYITKEGAVNGTCEGTGISLQPAYYLQRRRPSDDLHGRGAFLLAASELLLSPVGVSTSSHADSTQ